MKKTVLPVAMGMMILLALGCSQARDGVPSVGLPDPPIESAEGGINRQGAPMQWTTYTHPSQGFSLSFPSMYVNLREPEDLSTTAPDLIGRVRFLEQDLARTEFAELEPPKFSVEVYANPGGQPLHDWLRQHAPAGDVTDAAVDGRACLQLALRAQMAPNRFLFCAHQGRIYRFIPLGPYSREMLDSFRFGP
jgi:hypothetical protein